jgi:hypothetical protein
VSLLPNFVIVGAQKSGSTVLAESLRQHPQVFMPAGETHYFMDPYYGTAEPRDLQRLFASDHGARRRGIKCPDYLGQEQCAQRIASELGLVEILAVLRDPVSRAISNYYWWMRWGALPVEPVDVGMMRVLNGEYAGVRQADEILEFGLYGKHLERYLDIYGPDRVLVLLDEDLKADAEATRARVYRFLGVDEHFEPRLTRRSGNEGVYPLRRLKFLRMRNRFVYDNGDPMTGTMRRPTRAVQALPNAAVVLADQYVLKRFLGNERPPLSRQVESALREFYAEDVKKTQSLIDRDLSAWLPR